MHFPDLVEIAVLLLGLLFGSFLNVCISRLPYYESIVKPRSHCPHCMNTIAWYDNLPLVSFVLLRARCRKCFQRISWQYPLVELSVGLWFLWVWRGLPGTTEAPFVVDLIGAALLGFLLIGLLVMDWQTHILPDAFTLTGIVIGFLLVCTQAIFMAPGQGDIHLHHAMRMSSPGSMVEKGDVFLTGPEHLVFGRLLAICASAGLLLLVRLLYKTLRHRDGLGLGDAKLLAMIAAFLGFWPTMLALFLGVILCSLYAVVLLLRGKASATTRLPLGTFLSVGGLLAAALGPSIITWYSSLM